MKCPIALDQLSESVGPHAAIFFALLSSSSTRNRAGIELEDCFLFKNHASGHPDCYRILIAFTPRAIKFDDKLMSCFFGGEEKKEREKQWGD